LWKARMIRLARPAPSVRALDLCCGTGDISFALAKGGAEVVGLDFSAAMLEVAEKRARQSGEPGSNAKKNLPAFIRGDAQNLPFADGEFQIVTISYGLRNLASCERGLEEMWRVTAPGGRLLVLDF